MRIAVYVPQKGDPIDKKLAEYINNQPHNEKLKLMFMRVEDGVYDFGSRKILLKIERDKLQVKVGGGHLLIDDFVQQYTTAEVKKVERRDPLNKFSESVAI